MKTHNILLIIACAGLFVACAAAVPRELVDARAAYQRASAGPAAQVAQAQLHVANQALAKAEQSFQDNSDSYQTRDLAYVAQRRSELAEAEASIAIEQKNQTQAKNEYQSTQGKIVTETKQELAAAKQSGEMTAEKLSAEKEARAAADKRAAEAQAALEKLAAVKEEPRGMVITLSGSVLFASNQATLLPEARARLDQVSDVLMTTRERNLSVEGYTDSQGSDSHNLDLSQRRADAVRNYIVQRGYQADRVKSRGFGEGNPVADNANAEGRANNRRVEIIIERDLQATNK
jgi:outer membrane protein OmpA-like peptidoglycan-associated protein